MQRCDTNNKNVDAKIQIKRQAKRSLSLGWVPLGWNERSNGSNKQKDKASTCCTNDVKKRTFEPKDANACVPKEEVKYQQKQKQKNNE